MKDLIVGQKYTLKHNLDFCHAVGAKGYKKFSPRMNEGDTIEAVYVGTINIGDADSQTMLRDVFYSPYNPKRNYIMFSSGIREYLTLKN